MRRARDWIVAVIAMAAVAALWHGAAPGAVSSTLSPDSRGWLAARRYLAERGVDVHLRDAPLTAADDAGLLVLAFPWQQAVTTAEIEALGGFLRGGGTVLLAYSGELGDFREKRILGALGTSLTEVRQAPPLTPLSWWRYHRATWTLEPAETWPGGPLLEIPALRTAAEAPAAARVLYRLADGTPLVFDYPLHRGRVLALPAAVLSNAWIAAAGNADLLESLRGWLGDAWSFDEYHHAFVGKASARESTSRYAWDLFLGHLALLYLLGPAARARRFGPVWRERPATAGSTASFLRSLGVLHGELGHHGDAARLLVARARAYSPSLSITAAIERRAEQVDDARKLVALAREVARIQRHQQRRTS